MFSVSMKKEFQEIYIFNPLPKITEIDFLQQKTKSKTGLQNITQKASTGAT